MKILIIDNSAITLIGKSYYTNNLNGLFINELNNLNNRLSYYQFFLISDSINSFCLNENGVKCYPVKFYRNKLIRYIIAYFKIILPILRNDFVYFYYPGSFKYAALFCILFKKKFGLYIRGMNQLNDKSTYYIYKHSSTIFTVSDIFTEDVKKIVNNRIPVNTIRPMIPFTDNDICYNRTYDKTSKFRIMYLGRIAKEKGITELLYSISELKKRDNKFELIIVGTGEFLEESMRLAIHLNISDMVIFKGAILNIEEIRKSYLGSDLFILPSYHEGFARTLYEAMIFGTPIITTLVGGIKALMKHNYNCLEIKPKSIHSIVESIEYAINNYALMQKLATNGFHTVEKIIDKNRLSHALHLNQIIKSDG